MNTKTTTALALAFGILCNSSYSRLNETLEECITRYGQPKYGSDEEHQYGFKKNGYIIIVSFHEQKAEQIFFKKSDGYAEPMSSNEINTLLDANGAGKKWVQQALGSSWSWITDDKSAYARHESGSGFFVIVTKSFLERKKNEEIKAEKDKLDEF